MKKFKAQLQYNGEEAIITIEYTESRKLGLPSLPQELNLVTIFLPEDTIQFLAYDDQVDLIRDRLDTAKKENNRIVCDDSLIEF